MSLSTTVPPALYLASRSPRRRELLTQIGAPFLVLPFRGLPREDIDVLEDVRDGEDAEGYVVRVARAKALGGEQRLSWRRLSSGLVLSADTTVEVDGEILGKPADAADATRMLGLLSGRSHRVLTAVAVSDGRRLEHVLSISTVRFSALDARDIERYVASGEPMDKAGAYGIQGRAGAFVEHIDGSYTGIVGLPLNETWQLLRRFGLHF
ncbi:septum formation protein Maf [Methyloversatilis sp. RAC08]|uniref:Maf family protein n=1 Tax=Methyloversatilis sp. RAC08 TaxID=1842540 RepID=UPI00083CF87A|nr:Maf family protein [Methyloversatilis sp. RAC08]AOF82578.1 septum formation protein Maf [Methyloversatilis sp. RAC08]